MVQVHVTLHTRLGLMIALLVGHTTDVHSLICPMNYGPQGLYLTHFPRAGPEAWCGVEREK